MAINAPVFTLHHYFETKRESSYHEFDVEGSVPFPNEELMNTANKEAARLVVEDDEGVRYRCDGQDPTDLSGMILKDETFSNRELSKLRLFSKLKVRVRVEVYSYRN